MTITDTNPKTRTQTKALIDSKWRAVYKDGTHIEQITGQNQYAKIDRTKLAAFVIIGTDGKELLRVRVPSDKICAYRQRTILRQGRGVDVTKIVALVNKDNHEYQKLHILFRDGHVENVQHADRFKQYGRINLFPYER